MKVRTKVREFEAIQWNGDNWPEVYHWIRKWDIQDPGLDKLKNNSFTIRCGVDLQIVQLNYWIVRYGDESFEVLRPEVFEALYEPVSAAVRLANSPAIIDRE